MRRFEETQEAKLQEKDKEIFELKNGIKKVQCLLAPVKRILENMGGVRN